MGGVSKGECTERQRECVRLAVEGLSQTAAFLQVYGTDWLRGDPTGLRARSKASAFFRAPRVRALRERVREEWTRRQAVKAPHITRELEAVAFCSLPDMLTQGPDGLWRVKRIEELTEAQRRALKKVRMRVTTQRTEDGTSTVRQIELELHGKIEALTLLGKQLGMFKERVAMDIPQLDYVPYRRPEQGGTGPADGHDTHCKAGSGPARCPACGPSACGHGASMPATSAPGPATPSREGAKPSRG